MKSLYTVIFEDGTNFLGGTLIETKWVDIPNKPIKRILYNLPNGDNLVLNGYDKYFHMCEAVYDLNGQRKGQTHLEFDYIIGRKDRIVTCYKINIKTSNIKKILYKEDDKFVKGLNKQGWVGKEKEEEKK